MAERIFILPIHSSEDAGMVADISVAKLGEEAPVVGHLSELLDADNPIEETLVFEGDEAAVIKSGLAELIRDGDNKQYEVARRLLFSATDLADPSELHHLAA